MINLAVSSGRKKMYGIQAKQNENKLRFLGYLFSLLCVWLDVSCFYPSLLVKMHYDRIFMAVCDLLVF